MPLTFDILSKTVSKRYNLNAAEARETVKICEFFERKFETIEEFEEYLEYLEEQGK